MQTTSQNDLTIAGNVHDVRVLRRMSQEHIAGEMRRMGHDTWSRATVSQIENGGRWLKASELVSLAITLDCPVGDLLSEVDRLNGKR